MDEILGEFSVDRKTIINMRREDFLNELDDFWGNDLCVDENGCISYTYFHIFHNNLKIQELQDSKNFEFSITYDESYHEYIEEYINIIKYIFRVYNKICNKYEYLLSKSI